ncbi:shikimate dehydrogenase [Thaumasiovibrio subtropicus]|uniref:shikimate dehydrogenase n=1 Tax=Thaumasiovibrio subtropicus TaxID=1891207 RepID=UPI000B34D78F|nr:shikimate dehydrogenase [Thaumasiovibrio subtropicus]
MDRYRVYGNPIAQSKSPLIHTMFARQTAQSIEYTAQFEEDDLQFTDSVTHFFKEGGKGCNITAPFKEAAFEFATQLTERARLAGAVNTLKRLDDGGVLGDNTDGEGLVQDLLRNQVTLKGAHLLVLGAGGAARGVVLPLLEQQPASITIANRTVAKARQLAEMFAEHGDVKAISLAEVGNCAVDVVINSTSAGLSGNIPAISASVIGPNVVCYDMVYRAETTAFNQWALNNGAKQVIDGLGMLVGQAAESFMLWRGLRPGTNQVLRELRRQLQQ